MAFNNNAINTCRPNRQQTKSVPKEVVNGRIYSRQQISRYLNGHGVLVNEKELTTPTADVAVRIYSFYISKILHIQSRGTLPELPLPFELRLDNSYTLKAFTTIQIYLFIADIIAGLIEDMPDSQQIIFLVKDVTKPSAQRLARFCTILTDYVQLDEQLDDLYYKNFCIEMTDKRNLCQQLDQENDNLVTLIGAARRHHQELQKVVDGIMINVDRLREEITELKEKITNMKEESKNIEVESSHADKSNKEMQDRLNNLKMDAELLERDIMGDYDVFKEELHVLETKRDEMYRKLEEAGEEKRVHYSRSNEVADKLQCLDNLHARAKECSEAIEMKLLPFEHKMLTMNGVCSSAVNKCTDAKMHLDDLQQEHQSTLQIIKNENENKLARCLTIENKIQASKDAIVQIQDSKKQKANMIAGINEKILFEETRLNETQCQYDKLKKQFLISMEKYEDMCNKIVHEAGGLRSDYYQILEEISNSVDIVNKRLQQIDDKAQNENAIV